MQHIHLPYSRFIQAVGTIIMSTPPVNHLLKNLPAKEKALVQERCISIELTFGTVVSERKQSYRYAYFPVTGFISAVACVDDHVPLELGIIGYEGMLGATLILGVDEAPLRGVVQGSGSALRMEASILRDLLPECPVLHATLKRYLYVLMTQLNQAAGCTHFHEVSERLARWLLMSHDRARADHFYLTHQFLADMLGVQRSAVSIAAGNLQRKNLIHYSRGDINIIDRKGLEAASCGCYADASQNYANLFPE